MNDNTINPNILNLVAQKLFDNKVQSLEQDKSSEPYHLSEEQLERLASKMLLLPDDWQEALLLHYGCGFDSELTGDILEIDKSKENILYAKDTLAYSMGIVNIADESITAACHIALKQWHTQVKESRLSEPYMPASRDFDKKMRCLFHRQANTVYESFRTVAKRVAIFLLVALITSAITVFSVEALRNKFFDWWFSVFPTHTRVEFVDVVLPSGVDYAGHLNLYAPTYIPEGFILVDTYESSQRYKLFYENVEGERIIFEIIPINAQKHADFDTEDAEIAQITINGREGYYIYNEPGYLIFWSDELYFFSIICETTENDAIKIAKSTKLK